jgi:antagonist of KipI
MKPIVIERAGICSTLQDLGRPEGGRWGVPWGGAMDRVAHRLASLLVGNSPDLATIEMTVIGDTLHFPEETLIAWTGADLGGVLELLGRSLPLPAERPVVVAAGCRLRLGTAAPRGCRGYLAVAGGFAVAPVLGSQSTSLRSGWGGWQGRALKTGDQLPRGTESEWSQRIRARLGNCGEQLVRSVPWFYRPLPLADQATITLRVVRGKHWSALSPASQKLFFSEFQVTPQSDRMGYRLAGQPLEFGSVMQELKSSGTVRGTIQLPLGSHQPILLMADGAPTGGYPELAHVIAADWALAGQLAPGTPICFREVDLAEAHLRLKEQEQGLRLIADSVRRWAKESGGKRGNHDTPG